MLQKYFISFAIIHLYFMIWLCNKNKIFILIKKLIINIIFEVI